MNKRQVIIFWAIAIVLGGAVTAVKLTQQQTTQSATQRAPGQTLLASFPAGEIAAVDIQGAAGSVSLVKKSGKWTVAQRDGYPANATYVNEFLRTLGELKVTRGMEAGPSFASRFGMDESSSQAAERGLTASFKDAAGKEIAKVSLGKSIESSAAPSPMGGNNAVGRYVRNHADASGFYAVNEMFPAVSADVVRWLADDFLSPEKIQAITLSQAGKENPAWTLSRETEDAEFKLEGAAAGETLDTTVAAPLKSLFSYARFEDVVSADQATARADAAARRKVVIRTVEGFTYNLTLTPAKATATPPPTGQPAAADSYFLTVAVSAQLPKERKKDAGEKPEDAKTKDAAFTERVKTLTEKLAKEQSLAGRTFEVAKSTVEPLLKDRAQLIAKAAPPPAPDPNTGAVQKLPGGLITSPPAQSNLAPAPRPKPPAHTSATTPPIEVTTPPISIPATEEPKKGAKDGAQKK